ncbi:MAG: amino acid-binding protein, partial [Bacteroidaceae bacterium]
MTDLKIQQISIFLENIEGRINDVTTTLAKENINMLAFSMAETAE